MADNWKIERGDVLEVAAGLPDCHFDGVLCDPPYGLKFMGKGWDHGVPGVEYWREIWRVLKPGAMLLAFGGTRTFHRLTCAIEDAGFEVRDCVMWVYGSGFPKSLDISKALDSAAGAERERIKRTRVDGKPCGRGGGSLNNGSDVALMVGAPITDIAHAWSGYGTALKPAWEPCIVAMKPLDGTFAGNAAKWGVAGINVAAGRVGISEELPAYKIPGNGKVGSGGIYGGGYVGKWENTNPHDESVRHNALGRWPANVIHDGSAEVLAGFPETGRGQIGGCNDPNGSLGFHGNGGGRSVPGVVDSGSAARFFYCAKASRSEREAGLREASFQSGCGGDMPVDDDGQERDRFKVKARNHHPTVKPLDLCRYLAALILPPKRDTPRRLLTPFSGSGSEMIGALIAGWDEATGIEREAEYIEIAEARLAHWTASNAPPIKKNGKRPSPELQEAFL